ncbi:MAG TPA: twin-arginine translocase subunit TatC [Candidatus Omnitrophota bacterium]|nr:twin-arginine translocase subunit TatC [Candidatus Omnitrophota bacterium]HPN88328.1 twin-arginine translocase subunit TatC [Candidatus Omnitrophota bacterium]
MIKNPNPATDFSFWDHLEELRFRLIKIVLAVAFFSFFSYPFTDTLLSYLTQPIGKLFFTALTEAFEVKIFLALWSGFFLSLPFVFYQVWEFIAMGLHPQEKKNIVILSFFSFGLFIIGAFFAYGFLIPFGVKFFLSFSSESLVPLLTIKQYLSFVGMLVLTGGMIFQLPLVILFLTKYGMVNPQFLSQKRREAVVIFLILSAVITPQTDVITQVLVFLPLMILYEISVFISRGIVPDKEA